MSGLHVYQHLFSQIKALAQASSADTPISHLWMLQRFYSLQTLQFAQQHILKTKFKVVESLDQGRSRVNNHYMTIIAKGVSLLESYRENQDQAKIESLRADILVKVVQTSQFANLEMSNYLAKLMASNNNEQLAQLLQLCLSKELIWPKSQYTVVQEPPREKKGGLAL